MRVLITGATGFVGKYLIKELLAQDHEVRVLTRNADKHQGTFGPKVAYFSWNPQQDLPPKEAFVTDTGENAVDVVINLMGENISNKRWSVDQKKKIFNSRILGTNNLVTAINTYLNKPLDTFISTSAIGLYEANTPDVLNEDGIMGKGFLPNVCQEWEEAANKATNVKRRLITRVGVVFGNDGGALQKLLPIFKLGGGGPIGNGKQIMSWIHVMDLVNIYIQALNNEKYTGVVNAVSPNPVSNADFTKSFAKAVRRPAFFPVPPIMLRLIFGEMASIILDGQTVKPSALNSIGHQFLYADIQNAMNEICGNVNLLGLPKS
jgi:uncharacterized protein (TIGR01777 family)